MRLQNALRMAKLAAKENLLPGLLLQCLMIVFLWLYFQHEGTRQFLSKVAIWKREAGFGFAFFSYVFAAALLPEILRIAFFQKGRVVRRNFWNVLTAAPLWGMMGITVDIFYRLQNSWFGGDHAWHVVLLKMLVDQLIYSPFFSTPLTVGILTWRDAGFSRESLRQIFTTDFALGKVLPVQFAGWLIWVPGVCIVYYMPPLLQVPIAVLIQCFWVLIFTTINERKEAVARQIP